MAEDALTFGLLPPAARFAIRAGTSAETLIGIAAGVKLPWTVCRAETAQGRAALWLGPDEWVLIAPAREERALAGRIGASLGDTPASVVNISDRDVGIAVSGRRAAEAINGYCPLDLSAGAFPVGMCTRTVFGKTGIVLWRTGADQFRIEVARSFAPYILACLEEAGPDEIT